MNILERADQIVNHRSEEKERQYGPFSESMKKAAELYNLISPPPLKNYARGDVQGFNSLKTYERVLWA